MSRIAHHDDEWRNALALHALDLLDSGESGIIEQHLAEGCDECEAELRSLRETAANIIGLTAAISHPEAGLREKVLALSQFARDRDDRMTEVGVQVWKNWAPTLSSGPEVVRSTEGDWQEVHPGVFAKRLYVDVQRDTVTMLVRMQPGSQYIPHRHAGPEQCFVLDGDLREQGSVVGTGDFQCFPQGSVHGAQWTENGCILLIVSSLHDQLLA